MRQIAAKKLISYPSVSVIDGSAEDTKLLGQSVDLITVAQAIHWFDPGPTKAEMLRILKKNGWLALVRNEGTDETLGEALEGLMGEEFGADFSATVERPKDEPPSYYFGNDDFQKLILPFIDQQNWEEFRACTH